MGLTPDEIRRWRFSSYFCGCEEIDGVDREEVEEFFERLALELEALAKENTELKRASSGGAAPAPAAHPPSSPRSAGAPAGDRQWRFSSHFCGCQGVQGTNRNEVKAFLAQLALELETLAQENAGMRERLAACQSTTR